MIWNVSRRTFGVSKEALTILPEVLKVYILKEQRISLKEFKISLKLLEYFEKNVKCHFWNEHSNSIRLMLVGHV